MSNGTGPTGDVLHGMQFTHCVSKDDYSNPVSFGLDAGLATLGKDACDYLLGRKLICLGGVKCAIGTIIHIEPVGYHKPFPEDIDNDFCVNVLLFPHEVGEFGPSTGPTDKLANWHEVTGDGVQGTLILHDPSAMPTPKEPASEPTPYTATSTASPTARSRTSRTRTRRSGRLRRRSRTRLGSSGSRSRCSTPSSRARASSPAARRSPRSSTSRAAGPGAAAARRSGGSRSSAT
jgi:hypothetical protein